MRVKSYRKEYEAETRKKLIRFLIEASLLLERGMKESMKGKGPPPSLPGEPPHVRTGTLRRSVTHEIDKTNLIARIGSNLTYARYLELGTHKMYARPFIRPAFEKYLEGIRRTLNTIMRQ